jgi:DNA polymerase-3 subunit epsilon
MMVMAASEDDCKLHEQMLAEIAKASKKDPVWERAVNTAQ